MLPAGLSLVGRQRVLPALLVPLVLGPEHRYLSGANCGRSCRPRCCVWIGPAALGLCSPCDARRSLTHPRTDWTREEIAALFDLPFTELVFRAAEAHRAHHRAGEVQLCTLLSIKT